MKQSNRNPFNPSTNLRRSAFFAEPCTLQAPQLEASFNGIEIDRPLSAPSPLKPADIEALKEILEKLPGRPRVTLHHPDGRIEEVSEKNTPGLDEAAKSFAGDAELPESGTFFAWQNCDDAHPAEGGAAGYRIVYKMVRTIATPMLDLVGPNFRIRIGNDSVRYGETIFRNSMTWKHSDTFLVPEWGALATQGDPLSYTPFPPPRIDIEGKEDETPPCNHVEILLALNLPPDTGYSDHLREGRMKLAPMIAALDLLYGVRLLGPIITEEIGAVFDDWHWNRKLGGRQFLYEPQARLKYLPTTLFMEAFEVFSELHRERDDKDRLRVRIASQWHLQARTLSDPLMQLTAYWLCIEALELEGRETDIAPIKKIVSNLTGCIEKEVAKFIGRIYGARSKVLHGKTASVPLDIVDSARTVSEMLLERRLLGSPSDQTLHEMRTLVSRHA